MASELSTSASSAYSVAQFDDNYPAGMERNYWIYARSQIITQHIRRIIREGDLILDIGCGAGVVVDHLVSRGFSCFGVEPGHPTIRYDCSDKIFTGRAISQLDSSVRDRATIVLLLDVLEHVAKPEELLQEVRSYLPHVRHIVVTVPARRELWSNYDEYFGHYLRYSPRALRQLLEDRGFKVSLLEYFFHWLYIPMLLCNLLARKRAIRNSSPSPRWLHSLLAQICIWDERLLPRWIIGSSLLAICTAKPNESADF
jgi:2-polyprenyl-3-methyl-5-hydroxy-6-metoxy-1,4-benzoquinol methylase